ncbi:MAG: signal peptidase II [Proteobacteria bacterium]|nr:signal peptidase II [Pseudomonadota bacterium]
MIGFLYIVFIFLSDFLSKYWIVQTICYGETLSVSPFFNIVHAKNFGVSFSLLSNNHELGPWILFALSICIVLFLVLQLKNSETTLQKWAIYSIIGGALGNAFDRLYYGSVVDFLDLYYQNYHWPAFNIADCFIVCGVFLYLLTTYKSKN